MKQLSVLMPELMNEFVSDSMTALTMSAVSGCNPRQLIDKLKRQFKVKTTWRDTVAPEI